MLKIASISHSSEFSPSIAFADTQKSLFLRAIVLIHTFYSYNLSMFFSAQRYGGPWRSVLNTTSVLGSTRKIFVNVGRGSVVDEK